MPEQLIGRALDISEGTVKTYVKNILEKLDATSDLVEFDLPKE